VGLLSEVLGAENRIRKYVRETPLEYSIPLSKLGVRKSISSLRIFRLAGPSRLGEF